MLKTRHPKSHVPRFRVRVDTRRPGDDSRSGCRGFSGLVPQPLFMKSKVCSEEQTCLRYYTLRIASVKLMLESVESVEGSISLKPPPLDASAGKDRFVHRQEA